MNNIELVKGEVKWALETLKGKWEEEGFNNCVGFMDRYGYHNINHIAQLLKKYNEWVKKGYTPKDPRMILCAFWHDTFPKEVDRSALSFAMLAWHQLKITGRDWSIVADLINSTDHNFDDMKYLETHNQQVFHDLDWSILVENRATLLKYEEGIRSEYSEFNDKEYVAGRTIFLQKVINKKVFCTRFAADLKWEEKAKRNAKFLLTNLKKYKDN